MRIYSEVSATAGDIEFFNASNTRRAGRDVYGSWSLTRWGRHRRLTVWTPRELCWCYVATVRDDGDAVRWVAEGVVTRNGEEVMP